MERRCAWRLVDAEGYLLARCEALDAIPGIAHAVSTRRARGIGFDLGTAEDCGGPLEARRAALVQAAGCLGSRPAILRQVHGSRVVRSTDLGDARLEADGVVGFRGDGPGAPVPAVRMADCAAVLLASGGGDAFAAVHAGWRGIAAGIVREAVRRLAEPGWAPSTLVAAIGPSIGPCCYEVGDEVVEAIVAAGVPESSLFVRTVPGGRPRVDLHAALARQLADAGVPAEAIHPAPWCTRCRNDLFFSFRAEGRDVGRLMAVVGPRAARP